MFSLIDKKLNKCVFFPFGECATIRATLSCAFHYVRRLAKLAKHILCLYHWFALLPFLFDR